MKLFMRLSVSAGTLMVSLALVSSALGSSGFMTITGNTRLTEDHHGNIWIGADSVTLDCAGHAVTSAEGQLGTGVGITVNSHSDVKIRECRVSGFATGIVLQLGTGNRVLDSTMSDNAELGIGLYGATDTRLSGNRVSGSTFGFYVTPTGIAGQESARNRLARNTATGNSLSGFALADPHSTQLVRNTSSMNGNYGFVLWNWKDGPLANRLADNTSTGNGWSGFALFGGADNSLVGNTSAHNDLGFNVSSSDGLVAKHNVAESNTASGFLVNTVAGGALTDNVAAGNGANGFHLYQSSDSTFTLNVSNNNLNGFLVTYGTGNTLTKNVANHNQFSGFRLHFGSTANVVKQSVAHANGDNDARDDNAYGANTWLKNDFGNAVLPEP